jgi:hypothetical protein
LQELEQRTLPSTNIWTGNVSNLWNVAGNWANGIPVAGQDVQISSAVNTPVVLSGSPANIDSLTSSQPVSLQGVSLTLTGGGTPITGGLTLTKSASLTITAGGNLNVTTNNQTFASSDSSGSVVFGDSNGNNALTVASGLQLAVVAGFTIKGQTGLLNGGGTLVNQGTIVANSSGNTITLSFSGGVTNTGGTLEAMGKGILALNTAVTGGTITTDTGLGSTVQQNGAPITGAAISGELVPNVSSNNQLSGVTVSSMGTVDMSGFSVLERVTAGLTLNGIVSLKSASILGFGVPANEIESVTGSGSIVFADNNTNNEVSLDNGVSLTIGAGVTVRGNAGIIGRAAFVAPTGTLTLQGVLQADTAGGTLTLFASTSNSNTLQALNGGTLSLRAPVTGGMITTDTGQGSAVQQNGALITGATISGELVPNVSSNNQLSGVTVSSTGTVDMSGVWERVTGGLTLNGIISIRSASILGFGVLANEKESVSGSGNIVFADSNGNNLISLDNGVVLTLESASPTAILTLRGNTGTIGQAAFAGPTGSLINNQFISADTGNGTLIINAASFTNNSSITVFPGSTINVTSANFTNFNSATSTLNSGDPGPLGIRIAEFNIGGTFEFPGAHIVTNGAFIQLNGPMWSILNNQNGASGLNNVLTTNSADLNLNTGATLTTPGSFTNLGSVGVDNPFTKLIVMGTYMQTADFSDTFLFDGGTVVSTAGAVAISAGTLEGNGNVSGNVTVNNTATLSPNMGATAGIIAITGNLTMQSGSTLTAAITGPNTTTPVGGTDYGQVSVTGTITLNNPTLNGSFGASNVPPSGTGFEIIDNLGASPVTGTFSGLPEGSPVSLNGVNFGVTYKGGDSTRDVVLTAGASTATITVSANMLNLGTTTAGTSSAPVSYTISGSNLTGPITITAPTGVQLSVDGATFLTSLTLTPTAGTVGTTTIGVRISASAAVGSISGKITDTSPGVTEQDVSVSGTVNPPPAITVSAMSLSLGTTTAGMASTPVSYMVSGSNLTGPITITAPAGVELSSDSGSTFHATLMLTPTSGTVMTTTIEARISASAAVGSISGKITDVSPGATERDVSVSGTVNPAPAITVSPTSLNLGMTTAGTAGTPVSYMVSGSNLTGPITITAPAGVELSSDGGSTFHATLMLTPTSGTVMTTTIAARISASAAVGSIGGNITDVSPGPAERDVSVSGTVNPAPAITVSATSLSLGTTTAGTASTPVSYMVSGSNLTGPITITPPAGVELSSDGGSTFHAMLMLTPSSGTVMTTTIEARISASATAGSISGKITDASPGATERDVSVSGTVNAAAAITVSTTSLNLGTTTVGTAGTPVSYMASGSNLTGSITITAPAGVELSADGGSTFHPSLMLMPSNGTVASTAIEVRISALATAGSISGKITDTSPGATERDVSVSGIVNGLPAITISTTSLNLGTTTAGTPGTPLSYMVSGSTLIGPITITAPPGVELSSDGGSTFHASLTLFPSNGTVASTTVEERISASAAGPISGKISNTSLAADERDVSVAGTVNALPAITVSTTSLNLGTTTVTAASTPVSYIISGSSLTGPITISAPAGVELSSDGGTTFHTSLTLAPINGTVAKTIIKMRISASAAGGTISGKITNTSPGATERDVSVSGSVNKASPTITTAAGPTVALGFGGTRARVVIGSGATMSDAARLSGGLNPTRTISFTLYDPSNAPAYTDVVIVSGDGIYSTATGNNPGGFLPPVPGTYEWVASYSGDSNNNAAVSTKGNDPELVYGPVAFWQNHPDAWPVASLTIAGVTYTKQQLTTVLAAPPQGDAVLILADQLIAYELNTASGVNFGNSLFSFFAPGAAVDGNKQLSLYFSTIDIGGNLLSHTPLSIYAWPGTSMEPDAIYLFYFNTGS